MKIEKSAGGVIINEGKVVLVYQNKTKSWALPKGHIDNKESVLETAKREIYEETGIKKIDFIKKLGSYIRNTRISPEILKEITFLLFTTKEKELNPIDPENPEAKWVFIDEVEDKLTYKEDKEFFKKIKGEII